MTVAEKRLIMTKCDELLTTVISGLAVANELFDSPKLEKARTLVLEARSLVSSIGPEELP